MAAGTIAEELPEGFQRAEFLFDHGFVDLVVPRAKLRETLISLLRYLKPANVVDTSKSNGNGVAPLGMPRSYIDAITGRSSGEPKEAVRG